jgi:predicted metal-dependent hydrolase
MQPTANHSSKAINIEGVGEIFIKKNSRSRRLSISISPSKGISVSIPYRVSFSEGEKFVFSKIDWIRKHFTSIQKINNSRTLFTEDTKFSILNRELQIGRNNKEAFLLKLTDTTILITIPENVEIANSKCQTVIRSMVIKAMQVEAKKYLPKRVAELANIHGFKHNRVSIKNAKTRWGSCSATNNINLSLHLLRLPQELCDYVILHELVHTVHKNHSKVFWDALDKVAINARLKAKKMREFRIDIY